MVKSERDLSIPSPIRDENSKIYFDAASEGRLMIKHCTTCNVYAAPVERYCGKCLTELQWEKASGKGKVFNWTIIHQAAHPGFMNETPYVIGTIELEENVRIFAKIPDVNPEELHIGMEVNAEFKRWPNGEYLPVFVRSK
ncbi:Zn-ribbon domain-containing OB-fold protein [Neobacillus vireti]|uniref:Zn-ribbon domain-containing OB-fold protein n=1 Tax=Neobacillus vireti TaxID=220686 RepID=UPI002FFD8FC3